MKKLLGLALTLFCCSTIEAQQCDDFWLMQKGKTIEMTSTNKKGKTSGVNRYVINDQSKDGGTVTSSVAFQLEDEKGKEVAKGNMTMKCNGGNYQVDMRQFIPQQSMEQMKDIESDAVFYLSYPANMAIGDVLEPGQANIEVSSSGIAMTMDIEITDRKVEGKEKVTTPAGSWDCFKISSQTAMRMKVGGVGIPIKSSSTEYFAPGFGIVKSETKYGKTEITAIK